MTVAELAQGLRLYRDYLQNEIRTCQHMLARRESSDANIFWKVTKECLVGCLGKLERQFPYLREL